MDKLKHLIFLMTIAGYILVFHREDGFLLSQPLFPDNSTGSYRPPVLPSDFAFGLSIIEPSVKDNILSFRVGNRVRRWIDVYAVGIKSDGDKIDLGHMGTIGTFDRTLILFTKSFETMFDEEPDMVVYPDPGYEPLQISVEHFDEIHIRCFGLGYDKDRSLTDDESYNFLISSAPTIYFSMFFQLYKTATGLTMPVDPTMSGRPKKEAIKALTHELMRRAFKGNSGSGPGVFKPIALDLFKLYRNGDYREFSFQFISTIKNEFFNLIEQNPKLIKDALVEIGVPRSELDFLSGKNIGNFLRILNLGDITNDFYNLILTIGALPFVPPITEFQILILKPENKLFVIDVSGSMRGSKIIQARNSALQSISYLEQQSKMQVKPLFVSLAVFGGPCQNDALKTIVGFTHEFELLKTAIRDELPNPTGDTPLNIARKEAENDFREFMVGKHEFKSSDCIILTDGEDTCDKTRPTNIYSSFISNLNNSHTNHAKYTSLVRYITVGFDINPGSNAERDLQYIAASSGGYYFHAENEYQLRRAFEKTVKEYLPKPPTQLAETSSKAWYTFVGGNRAFHDRDYKKALELFENYRDIAPTDINGLYNLALSQEACESYKSSAEHYKQYLELATDAPDQTKIQALIPELEQDYIDYFHYQVEIVKSDLAYLQDYYQRLFNQSNASLAAEFGGLVREKGEFYRNLPEILELETQSLKDASKSVSSGIDLIARQINAPTFDRDAVSLLSLPIKKLETLLNLLEVEKGKL